MHPVPFRFPRSLRNIGRIHIHLGGNTANIQARPAERSLFDDSDPLITELRPRNHIAGPRPDNHEVIVPRRRFGAIVDGLRNDRIIALSRRGCSH